MNLVDVQKWLNAILENPESIENRQNDLILKNIRQVSAENIDKKNETFQYPYNDFFDYLKGTDYSDYENRTLWGFYESMRYSNEIINSNDFKNKEILLYEWNDSLNFHLNDSQEGIHSQRIIVYKLGGNISKHTYQWSKKELYNSMVESLNLCISETGSFQYNPHLKAIMAESIRELLNDLADIDRGVGLSSVYKKSSTGIDWPHFWRAKFILEKIDRDLNKRPGGPKSKIQKHLQKGHEEFCQDVNRFIFESGCIDSDLIRTWDLAGYILDQEKYNFMTDQDGLNKLLKSVFDNDWLSFESKHDLSEILKFENNYYLILPNN